MDVTASPTITSPAITGVGVLLGTAAYMSPEQARGSTVDKRADIWAFAAVLYEMLTGARAFAGDDVSDVLASLLAREPDWSRLPTGLSPTLRLYIRRCLHKDPKQRIGDIRDVRLALEGAFETSVPHVATAVSRGRRLAAMTAGALVIVVVAGVAGWWLRRPVDSVAPPRVSRLPLVLSGTSAPSVNGTDRDLAVTPDGARVVYVGNRGTQLFVRALDTLEPSPVFTGTPRGPFVSPDGQWIGFVDGSNNTLKKIAMTGGPAVTVASLDGAPRGAAWAADDSIILATGNGDTELQRVAATGGPTTVLTKPDMAKSEGDHSWPELLPGGRALLFTITALTGGLDTAQVAVLDLESGRQTVVVRGGSHAHYVPSGHLVYATAGTLWAVPFDLTTLETRGTPAPVIPEVVTTASGSLDAVVTSDGTLAYVLGGMVGSVARRNLVWVDRQGRETPIPAPPRPYAQPRLSPDGTRIAVVAVDEEQDLWLWDLMRATLTRLTFEPRTDTTPVWTPDGRRLVFASGRGRGQNIYVQAADGTGSATRLTDSPNTLNPSAITADGMRVLFHELVPNHGRDLRLLTLTPTPRVESLVETQFDERGGVVSPDGRWLAYEASNSGRLEIYVRRFPKVNGGQWQVSNGGGIQPLWAPSGQELFFVGPTGALMTVPVESSDSAWSAGTTTTLVERPYYTGSAAYFTRHYDVSPDGQRFLMIKEAGDSNQTAEPPQIVVVQHWTEELKRLVPTN